MKRARSWPIIIVVLLALTMTLSTVPALAHVLQSNNGVSAILHIKPDDNPIAGKPTPINFLFSNDAGGFTLNDYKVQLRLLENGTVKYTSTVEPLFYGSASEGETLATFPEVGVYDLQAVGSPIQSGAPAFKLNFTVRVTGSSAAAKKNDGGTTAILSGFSLVLVGMVAVKTIQSGGKYNRPTKPKLANLK